MSPSAATIDLGAALQVNEARSKGLAVPTASTAYKRNLARTVILSGYAVERWTSTYVDAFCFASDHR